MRAIVGALVLALAMIAHTVTAQDVGVGWPSYGGDASGGRKYVVIAAGGHGALGGWGDSVIAFALSAAP